MENKIKFRAWDTKNNKFLEMVPMWERMLDNPDCDVSEPDSSDLFDLCFFYPKDPLGWTHKNRIIYQQFTGMKDREGKEIYDGDILCENHDEGSGEANLGRVFFAAGTFMIDGDGPLYEHTYSESPDILEDYKVVGNIFQDQDLIVKHNANFLQKKV